MKNRYFYVVLGFTLFLCMGSIYTWSVFRNPLAKELEIITGKEVGAIWMQMPYTLFLMMYSFSMPFSGFIVKKVNPKIICFFGSLLLGFAWIMAGNSKSILEITLTYGFLGGTAVGIVYGVPIAIANEWFPEKKGFASGLTLMGFGLSPLVTAPLASSLIQKYGSLATFKYIGLGFIVILSILSMFFKFPREHKEDENIITNNKELTPKEMIRSKSFYALWTCFIIGTFIGLTMVGITSIYAQETIGLSAQISAIVLSVFAIFNGVGRPLYGSMVDKYGPKKVIYMSYSLIAISGIMQLLFTKNIVCFIIGFMIFFLNLGGWLAIVPASNIKIFGSKYSAENYGILFSAYGVGAVFQGFVGGYIRNTFGSYKPLFYIVILVSLVGLLINKKYIVGKGGV